MINHFQITDGQGDDWVFPEYAITGVKIYEHKGGYEIDIYLSCQGCKIACYWVKTKIEAQKFVDQLFNMNQHKPYKI